MNDSTRNGSQGLCGRTYIVTGGGSGIGFACASRLVADGAAVTICGRDAGTLEAAVQRIRAATDAGSIQAVAADVTVEADVQRVVAAAVESGGRLDGCVANAGGGGIPAPYHAHGVEEFLRVLSLNVLSTMLCIKHTVQPMIAAGGGSFVGMSSLAANVTIPFHGAYNVAKAGIEAMIRNAADEYGRFNLRFNAIRPGFVATEIMAANLSPDGDIYRSYIENTPMGGVAQPEDIGNLARFLLGDEAKWITGQCIAVDGGHCLRRGPDFTDLVVKIHGHDLLTALAPK